MTMKKTRSVLAVEKLLLVKVFQSQLQKGADLPYSDMEAANHTS